MRFAHVAIATARGACLSELNVKLRGSALLRRPARTPGWASLFHTPMGKVAVTSMRAATTAARNAKSAAISEADMSG